MKAKWLTVASVILLALIVTPVAHAVPITRSDFGSDATIITFDDLATNTFVSTQYQDLGVTFSQGGYVEDLAVQLALNTNNALSVSSAMEADFAPGLNINMVGVDVVSNTLLTLYAYDASNNLIDSVAATSLRQFLGLYTGSTDIAKVIIHDHGYGFAIDNFTFSDPSSVQVPEPATVILLGSGLAGLGFFRRKRAKRS